MNHLSALRRRWLLPLNRFFLKLNLLLRRLFPTAAIGSLFVFLALLFLSLLMFYELPRGDMQDWDEAMYAWRAKSILYFGGATWLDQTAYAFPADHPWIDPQTGALVPKQELYSGSFPPLLVWLMALLFKCFGANNFTARLCPALTGAGTILCVYFSLKQLTCRRAAALAGAALTGSAPLFCEYAQKAQFDVPMAFFAMLTLTAWIYWHVTHRAHWLALCGASLGLGLLTKIALTYFAAIFIGLTGLYWLYACRGAAARRAFVAALALALAVLPLSKAAFAAITLALFAAAFILDLPAALRYTREMLAIHLIAAAISLPWHLFMCWKYGWLFPRWYIGYHLIERSGGALESHTGAWHYYLAELWKFLPAPALALTLLGICFGAAALLRTEPTTSAANARCDSSANDRTRRFPRIDWRRHGVKYFLPLIALLLPLILFSAARTKREPYSLLFFAPYGLLAGLALERLLQLRRRDAWKLLLALTLVAFLVIVDRDKSVMRDFVRQVLYKGHDDPLARNALITLKLYLPLLAAAAGIAAAVLALFGAGRSGRGAALLAIIGVTAVFAARKYDHHFLAGKGHHNFGWSIIEPHVNDRDSYDVLVFAGGWTYPSTVYYFDGQAGGISKNYDVFGREFIQIKAGMDPVAIINSIPPEKRVLLICEREYLRLNFQRRTIRTMQQGFWITPESREKLDNGDYPWLQVWRRVRP